MISFGLFIFRGILVNGFGFDIGIFGFFNGVFFLSCLDMLLIGVVVDGKVEEFIIFLDFFDIGLVEVLVGEGFGVFFTGCGNLVEEGVLVIV